MIFDILKMAAVPHVGSLIQNQTEPRRLCHYLENQLFSPSYEDGEVPRISQVARISKDQRKVARAPERKAGKKISRKYYFRILLSEISASSVVQFFWANFSVEGLDSICPTP